MQTDWLLGASMILLFIIVLLLIWKSNSTDKKLSEIFFREPKVSIPIAPLDPDEQAKLFNNLKSMNLEHRLDCLRYSLGNSYYCVLHVTGEGIVIHATSLSQEDIFDHVRDRKEIG